MPTVTQPGATHPTTQEAESRPDSSGPGSEAGIVWAGSHVNEPCGLWGESRPSPLSGRLCFGGLSGPEARRVFRGNAADVFGLGWAVVVLFGRLL